ncbi:MAG: diaminopimelate epimerase [Gemmatimonas sp.]|nr:diaminopimelate epimerase [Gemmatimonas sp.]
MDWLKAHGLGNDYLAIDAGRLPGELTPPVVRLICDRNHGLGSDGILVRVASSEADFGIRIYNPDGSEAEKSGNGLRIFAVYLLEAGDVTVGVPFRVETKSGTVRLEVVDVSPDGVYMVEAAMGRASFRSSAVGLQGPDREVDGETLELPGGDRVAIYTVSVGNPHCVCFEDELVLEDLRRRGPLISTHPWFAQGTNVQFARATGPDEVEAFVWERGAGETLASGSSACAVAAAAVRRGLVQEHAVRVVMPGGTLQVTVGAEWDLVLRGPVESVARARLSPGFIRRLEQLS